MTSKQRSRFGTATEAPSNLEAIRSRMRSGQLQWLTGRGLATTSIILRRTCSGHAIRNPGNALGFSHVAFDIPQSRSILRRLGGTLAISVMLMRHEGNEEIGAQDGRNDAKLRDS